MDEKIRKMAAKIITNRYLQLLEEAGLTVIPKIIADRVRECGINEELIWVSDGKFVAIREASTSDVDRITKGFVCMD